MKETKRNHGRRIHDQSIESLCVAHKQHISDIHNYYQFGILGFFTGIVIALSVSILFPGTVYDVVLQDNVETARPIAFLPSFLGGLTSTLLILVASANKVSKWTIGLATYALGNFAYWVVMISYNPKPMDMYKIMLTGAGTGIVLRFCYFAYKREGLSLPDPKPRAGMILD